MAFNLSLTKKSDEESAAAPLWHPNFRNFERLPDTKVVRTTFFVNTAAIAITLSLLLWLGFREYHLHDLREQIAAAQKVIDGNSRLSMDAIRLTKTFTDDQARLESASAFQRTPATLTELVTLLAKSLPKDISIDYMEARLAEANGTSTVLLKGSVAGTPDQASGAASKYVDGLRAHPRLGKLFDSIVLNNLVRGSSTSYLTFDIMLKGKAAGTEKK